MSVVRRESDPIAYLLEYSDTILQGILLNRFDRAASLRKQLREFIEELISEQVDAEICQFVIANRHRLLGTGALQIPLDFDQRFRQNRFALDYKTVGTRSSGTASADAEGLVQSAEAKAIRKAVRRKAAA